MESTDLVGMTRLRGSTVFLGFGAFGLLWGMYAAALPEIKSNAGVSDGELGTALACVGLAAAPAMFLTGRLLDRYGRPVVIGSLFLFAAVASLPTLATSATTLVVTLLLFGFGSGCCDVVINSLAATVEAETDGRVLNRAHALFSVGLLTGSVATSVTYGGGMTATWPLVGLAVVTIVGAWVLRGRVPRRLGRARQSDEPAGRRRVNAAVLAFGLLAALAMLVESGVQQWSAVFLEDGVGASPSLSGLAPGVFAGSMALGRLAGHWVSTRWSDRVVLLLSGLGSAFGVLVVAWSHQPLVALAGFAITGLAISTAAPTVYSVAGRNAPAERRGAVIGLTASIGYAGLLLGPVVVGQIADFTQLRTAIGALVVVSLALSIAALLLRTADGNDRPSQ